MPRKKLLCFLSSSLALAGWITPLTAAQEPWPELSLALVPDWPVLPAGWTLQETAGVAVDAREHVFVFHRGTPSIVEFDPTGNVVRSWSDGVYVRPHALKFDPEGNLWAVDDGGHVVTKLDARGRVRLVLGRKLTPGENEEYFNRPTDVAFGPDGSIYVADGYGNARIVKFDREGRFVTAWGRKGAAEGEFNLPHAVVVDRRGRVYVGDRDNARIQIFEADGRFVAQWKHVGSPWGLALVEDKFLFLCDGYANRIVKLDLAGNVLGTIGRPGRMPGQLNFCHHLAVGPSGSVYVAEIKNWRIQKLAPR